MSQIQNEEAPVAREDVSRLTEHLFRQEAGKLVSVLTGIFGIDRLQMAEDVVQEALVRALRTWPFYGVPKNPPAWITQTAKNLALDLIRREKSFRDKEPEIIATIEQLPAEPSPEETPVFENEIKDDKLRLMFACCHPQIPQEAQIALALKTLCGFSPAEIASAFLSREDAIAKRLVRARQKIRELQLPFEIPSGEELEPRLEAVLQTLYLLFNEGYKASSGENLIREELCGEAIRMVTFLAGHPAGNRPATHALAALMLLNAARFRARVDVDGNIVRLKEQHRSNWDKPMIGRGLRHLKESAAGPDITEYHLQAGISACHCTAPTYEATDWPQILSLYDCLAGMNDSPVVALNRAVAAANVHGPEAGLAAVAAIRKRGQLETYYLLHATLGEFESELGHFREAIEHFMKALALTEQSTEKAFLRKRLSECQQNARA